MQSTHTDYLSEVIILGLIQSLEKSDLASV